MDCHMPPTTKGIECWIRVNPRNHGNEENHGEFGSGARQRVKQRRDSVVA